MGFRFRKSISLGSGVRLNVGKRGVGLSAGVKDARVSTNTSGRRGLRAGISGTGIAYEAVRGGGGSKRRATPPRRRTSARTGVAIFLVYFITASLAWAYFESR